MADKRDILIRLLGEETVSRMAGKAGDGLDKFGDKLDATEHDAKDLDRQIGEVEGSLKTLAVAFARTGDAADRIDISKAMRRQQTELRKLTKAKDLLDFDRLGDEAAHGFAARFGARFGPLMASVSGSGAAAAGVALGAAMAPTLLAGLSGAVIGGAGLGGIVGGALIAARDPRVKKAGADLGEFIMGDLEKRAAGFVPVAITSIGKVRTAWTGMGPDLDRIFSSSRLVDPLVDGALSGGKKLIGGIADAVDKAAPVMEAFGRSFDAIGGAAGNFFTTLAGDAKEGASAIDDLTNSMVNLMDTATMITHYGAQLKGGADKLDVWIDRQRYAIEDGSLLAKVFELTGNKLDLTADGFKAGSKEAEAYRAATLGTATVTDFATLKMAGMTDAWIAGKDASGTYRNKIGEVNAAAGITTSRFYEGNAAMVIFNQSMADGVKSAGSLSAAFMTVNGAALTSREAESNYQAAIDNVSASIKANGTTLDLHTAKGRANDKAIRDLIGSTNAKAQAAYDEAYATQGAGAAQAAASKVYEGGRQQLIKNLTQILGNKDAAVALAGKIMAIPKKWDTNVDVKVKETPFNLQTLAGRIAAIKSKRVVVTVVNNQITTRSEGRNVGIGDGIGGRASGGPIKAGTPYMVGEEGPELITPTADGYVHDAGKTAALRSVLKTGRAPATAGTPAAGSMVHQTFNVSVNVPPTANPSETGRVLIDLIKTYERYNGTRWRQ